MYVRYGKFIHQLIGSRIVARMQPGSAGAAGPGSDAGFGLHLGGALPTYLSGHSDASMTVGVRHVLSSLERRRTAGGRSGPLSVGDFVCFNTYFAVIHRICERKFELRHIDSPVSSSEYAATRGQVFLVHDLNHTTCAQLTTPVDYR